MGLLSDSNSQSSVATHETGFNEIAGSAFSANFSAGDDLKGNTFNISTDSKPALNLAGEAVRSANNLADTVAKSSFEALSASQKDFVSTLDRQASSLQRFAEAATADPGDQIAGIVKLAIVGGLAVAVIVWSKG